MTQPAHPLVGRCLCGEIGITAHVAAPQIAACHCTMCQRWSGGPYVEFNGGTDVAFSGEDYIATYRSSDWAERGWCKNCGSHLFYRLIATQQYHLPAGLFDLPDDLPFAVEVFIDEKPGYYAFHGNRKRMTGQEVFAQFTKDAE